MFGAIGALALLGVFALRRGNPFLILVIVTCALVAGYRTHSVLDDRRSTLEQVRSLAKQRNQALRATVQELGTLDPSGIRYQAILTDLEVIRDGKSHHLQGEFRVHADREEQEAHFAKLASMVPGTRISFRGRIRPVEARYNFHASNPEEFALLRNLMGVINTDWQTVRVLASDGGPTWMPSRIVSGMRDGMTNFLDRLSPDASTGRLRGFLLNDYASMRREDIRNLRDSGLFHLYAISGTHFTAFGITLVTILRMFFSIRRAYLVATLMLLIYLAILDFQPAATRAFVMFAAVGACWLRRRESDGPSALVLAAFLLLSADPLLLVHRGFLLSFAGAFGLITVTSILTHSFQESSEKSLSHRIRLGMLSTFAATFGATLFVFPLQLLFFQSYHLLAPLANIPGALLTGWALAGSFAAGLISPVSETLSLAFGSFAAGCLDLLAGLSAWLARADWLIYRPPAPPLWAVYGYYALLMTGYHVVPISTPEFLKKATAQLALLSSSAVLALCMVTHVGAGSNHLRITILDVGQGDATLLEFPSSVTILVDGGNSASTHGIPILPAEVRALGVHRRPIVLATHVDSDHIAGLIPLVSQVPLAGLLEATPESTATLALRLREAYAQAGLPMAVIGAGDILYSGRDWSVRVLHPARAEDSNWERDPATAGRNQDSVVLHVRYGQFSALLMGDAPFSVESDLLDRGLIEPVTVLRLGHHGSRTSSHPTFLDRAQPALAVVSCGRDNSYGHPSRQVLEWLQERSIPLARTDLHGAIRIETDGENWRLSTVLQTQEDKVPKQGITLPRDSEHIADPLRPLPGVQVPSLN